MFEFYAVNGVITPAAMVGVFTGMLMNSLHSNVIKPASEHILPSHKLDNNGQESEFGNVDPTANKIKWQTFARDLIIWFVSLFIFYLIFRYVFKHKGTASTTVINK